ncbi:hypothetical protein EC991_000429 [Linnemannia zychae]|nr:hypothetical protein EC991_000429 [Linnemannia zychae]
MVYLGRNFDPNYHKKLGYNKSNGHPNGGNSNLPPPTGHFDRSPSSTSSIDGDRYRSTRSSSRPRLEDSIDRRTDRDRERDRERPLSRSYYNLPPPPPAARGRYDATPPSRHREVKREPREPEQIVSHKRERDRLDEGTSNKDTSGRTYKGSDKSSLTGTTSVNTSTNATSKNATGVTTDVTTNTSTGKKPNPNSKLSATEKKSRLEAHLQRNPDDVAAHDNARKKYGEDILGQVANNPKQSGTSVSDPSDNRKEMIDSQQQQLQSSSLSNLAQTLQEQQQQHRNTLEEGQYNNNNTNHHVDIPESQIQQSSATSTTSTIDNESSWAQSPSILSSMSSPAQSPVSSTTTADSHLGPFLDSVSCSQKAGVELVSSEIVVEHPLATSSEQPYQQQPSGSASLQPSFNNIVTMAPSLELQAVDEKINHLDSLWSSGSDKLAQTTKVAEQGVLTCVLQQLLEEIRIYANLRETLQNLNFNGQAGTVETLRETMQQLEVRRTYDIRCLQPGVPIPEMPLDQCIPVPPAKVSVNGSHLAVSNSGRGPESTTIKPATEVAPETPPSTDVEQQLSISTDSHTYSTTTTPDNSRKRPLLSEGTEASHSQLTKTTKKSHENSVPAKHFPLPNQLSNLATIARSGGDGAGKSAGTNAAQQSTLDNTTIPTPTPTPTPAQGSESVSSKNKPLTTVVPVRGSTSAGANNTTAVDSCTSSSLTTPPPIVIVADPTLSSSTTTVTAGSLDTEAGSSATPGNITTITTAPRTTITRGQVILDIEQELRLIRQEGQEQRLRTEQLLAQLESEARLRRESDARVAQLTRDLQNERHLTLEKELESKRSEALLMMAKAREELQHGQVLIAQAREELAIERAAKAEAMVETAKMQVERDRLLAYVQSLGRSSPGSGPGSIAVTLSEAAGADLVAMRPVTPTK